jgi:carbon monoxide dehydrogenase subunit G
MLHFEGEKDLAPPPHELVTKLGDGRFLAQCLPGSERIVKAEPDVVVVQVRPGFSFVRGVLEITIRVAQIVPDDFVRYEVHGKGIGSFNDVVAEVRITPRDGGSHVHWAANVVELGGLLRAIPQGLIKAAAQKVIEDVWGQVEAKLGARG